MKKELKVKDFLKSAFKLLCGMIIIDFISFLVALFFALIDANNVVFNVVISAMMPLLILLGFICNPLSVKSNGYVILSFILILLYFAEVCLDYELIYPRAFFFAQLLEELFIIENSMNIYAVIATPIIYVGLIALGGFFRDKAHKRIHNINN